MDVSIKFYSAEGDPAIIDAVVEAVYAVLSIDNVRLMQDGDDDVLLISAGRCNGSNPRKPCSGPPASAPASSSCWLQGHWCSRSSRRE